MNNTIIKNTIWETYKYLKSEKDIFVKQNPLIKNFWLSNKKMVKNIITRSKNNEEIDTYVTLCPFYSDWWIRWDYSSFENLPNRYQNKLNSALDIIDFLWNYFSMNIKFLLSDLWIMIMDPNFDRSNFTKIIDDTICIYKNRLIEKLWSWNFSLSTFSEEWIKLDSICDCSELNIKTKEDIYIILQEYWINSDKFKFSLDVIIKSFWITWAYYLVKNYLEENKQLIERYDDSIFVNVEVCSPLNSLYTVWKYKLNATNLFAKVDINS